MPRLPPQHSNQHISKTIIPNVIRFWILATNRWLYECIKFYLKRVIIIEVIRKTKVVSLLLGHGVHAVGSEACTGNDCLLN